MHGQADAIARLTLRMAPPSRKESHYYRATTLPARRSTVEKPILRPEAMARQHSALRTLATVALMTLAALSASCASTPEFGVRIDVGTVYARNGGTAQIADVFVPEGRGPFPAIVLIHGGGWRKGGSWQMDHIANRLAEQGFVVANINYRLAPAFKYPAQLEDVESAVRWLREHATQYRCDPQRIGAWGYSAGAHLALLVATRNQPVSPGTTSTRIKAVVGGGTPTDMLLFGDSDIVNGFMGGTAANLPDAYRDASPVSHVSPDDPPAFLYHGKQDWIVAPQHTHLLADRLRAAGVKVQVQEPFFGHIAVFLFGRAEETAALEFLRQQLHPPAR